MIKSEVGHDELMPYVPVGIKDTKKNKKKK